MIDKKIGKIKSVKYGFGGYQGCMFGVTFDLGSDKDSWGVGDFKGAWGPEIKVDKYTKWTEKDRSNQYADTARFVADLMMKANVRDLNDLVGVPVEVTFEGNCLKEWRVLEEAI